MRAIVTGRLIVMFLCVVIKWVLQPVHFITLVLYTLMETVVTGLTNFAAYLQKLNNEQLSNKAK